MGNDKREYSRTEISWPVYMNTTGGLVDGELKDISMGGALIRCRKPPMVDESFELIIEIPEYASQVSAIVEQVRLHTQDNENAFPLYELAVRFTDISGDDFRLLCRAVESQPGLQSRRRMVKRADLSGVEKGVLSSMEKLSRDLNRSFSDLLQEALRDFVKKYEKETSKPFMKHPG
jgi:hypothetical protein